VEAFNTVGETSHRRKGVAEKKKKAVQSKLSMVYLRRIIL
jgi:hypothetical protein